MGSSGAVTLIIGVIGVAVLLIVILIPTSFSDVEYYEVSSGLILSLFVCIKCVLLRAASEHLWSLFERRAKFKSTPDSYIVIQKYFEHYFWIVGVTYRREKLGIEVWETTPYPTFDIQVAFVMQSFTVLILSPNHNSHIYGVLVTPLNLQRIDVKSFTLKCANDYLFLNSNMWSTNSV